MSPLSGDEIRAYLDGDELGYRIVRRTYERGRWKDQPLRRMPCDHGTCFNDVAERIFQKFYEGIAYKGHSYPDYARVRARLRNLTASFFDGKKYSGGINKYCKFRRTASLKTEDTIVDGGSSMLDWLCSGEIFETVMAELFSIKGCTCLYLRAFENLSYKQIAELRNIPMGTVGANIHRVREELFRRLVALGIIDEPGAA